MNFLEGTVEREEGKTFIRHNAIRLEVPTRPSSGELPEEIVLGIRPSHLRIQSTAKAMGALGQKSLWSSLSAT